MSFLRASAVAVVSVALVVGLVEAPHLREPGRSERSGIRLAPDADSTATDADWTYSARSTTVRRTPPSITIEPRTRGLQLISRPLALVEGACYDVSVELAARGDIKLVLLSEFADRKLQAADVAPSATPRPVRLTFEAADSRLTLAIAAAYRNASAVLGESTISPRAC